jgi:hypothetical protein
VCTQCPVKLADMRIGDRNHNAPHLEWWTQPYYSPHPRNVLLTSPQHARTPPHKHTKDHCFGKHKSPPPTSLPRCHGPHPLIFAARNTCMLELNTVTSGRHSCCNSNRICMLSYQFLHIMIVNKKISRCTPTYNGSIVDIYQQAVPNKCVEQLI